MIPDTWTRISTIDDDIIDVDHSVDDVMTLIKTSNKFIEVRSIRGGRRMINIDHISSFYESGVDRIREARDYSKALEEIIDPKPTWDRD